MVAAERPSGAEQPQPSPLPIIPSEITNSLLEQLTLLPDQRSDTIPYNHLESFTTEVFHDLISSNRKFVEIVNAVFNERFNPYYQVNGALMGAALIIKSFDHLKDFDLLHRFSTLQPNDIIGAQQTLGKALPEKDSKLTLLQRLLDLPRIPETQINLNACLKRAEGNTAGGTQGFREGATAMYKVLEVLWPKLYPPQTSPQTPPPPQPTTQ